MDLGHALRYPLNDEKWWLKCLVMGGCTLLVVTSPIAIGYALETARQASLDPNSKLPELKSEPEYWFGLFIEGLKLGLINIIYLLPAFLLIMLSVGLGCGFNAMADGATANEGTLAIILSGMALGCIVGIACALVFTVAYLFVMRDKTFSSGFNIVEAVRLACSNPGSIALFMLFGAIINFIASFVGQLLLAVGVIITGPYAMLAMADLYGQLARNLDVVPHSALYE